MSSSSASPAVPAPNCPWVQAAFICEMVVTSNDGVLSYIRVIDRVTVGAVGPDPPPTMPVQQINYTLCLTLKSGEARGRYALKIRPEKPSGEQLPALEIALNMEGQERGANVNIGLVGIPFDTEGLWWFDVLFGDNETLLTRVPFRLQYQPQRVGTGQTESPQ
jgi:hypothetical protein